MMKCCVVFSLIVVVIAVGFAFLTPTTKGVDLRIAREVDKPRWWGVGNATEVDTSIRPFKIDVDDDILDDLKAKLKRTKYFGAIEEEIDWSYGTPPNFTRDLVEYWRDEYDWKKQQQNLNQHDHFLTNIDGIDVHFMHIKAVNNPNAKPLLMVHGWPGCFAEFMQIIPILTNPTKYGGDDSNAWTLVIPSIPGYGFSERSHKIGFDLVEAALIFSKLMKRLGYNRYAYQGGDWGSAIGTTIGRLDPDHCVAVHVNMALLPYTGSNIAQLLVGSVFPDLVFSEIDQQKVLPASKHLSIIMREMGYLHLQATRPYSVGQALSDSPAGLAAYIGEKFYAWSDCSGNIYSRFTKDQLLTNIMIYYVTNSISSSIVFYKEVLRNMDQVNTIDFPVAFAEFKDILQYPQSWTEALYLTLLSILNFTNLISYTPMPSGGHFAAMEEPLLLAKDLWKFNQKITWW